MSGNQVRLQAIEAVKSYQAPEEISPSPEGPGAVFGPNVFTKAVMQKRLPKAVLKSLTDTIAALPDRTGHERGQPEEHRCRS
jgi:glutamine synthetase